MSAVNFRHVINTSSPFAVLNDNRAVLLSQAAFYALQISCADTVSLAAFEWTLLTMLLRQEECVRQKGDHCMAVVIHLFYVPSTL
jgi:hypothetical protein